jgi:hypothetical protein
VSNDDILCEKPGPGGRVCTLPYGHQPENVHAFEVELPADLGNMIDGIMTNAEEARKKYEKAYKQQRVLFYLWGGMCILYLGLTIMKWVNP